MTEQGQPAWPELTRDCTRCAALCCVAYPFDGTGGFGLEKQTDQPCPHLETSLRCAIHASLTARGFDGCARYECYGAGQRVTAELFGGQTWREAPDVLAQMTEALRRLQPIHADLRTLQSALALPLPEEKMREGKALADVLNAPARELLSDQAGDVARARAALPAYLRSLAVFVRPPEPRQ